MKERALRDSRFCAQFIDRRRVVALCADQGEGGGEDLLPGGGLYGADRSSGPFSCAHKVPTGWYFVKENVEDRGAIRIPSPAGLTRGSMDRRVKPGDDESGLVDLVETRPSRLSRPTRGTRAHAGFRDPRRITGSAPCTRWSRRVLYATQEPFSFPAARHLSTLQFVCLTQIALLISIPLVSGGPASRRDFVALITDVSNYGKLAIIFAIGMTGLLLYNFGLSNAHPIIISMILNLSPFWAAAVALILPGSRSRSRR